MSKNNIHKSMMSGFGKCPIDKNYEGGLEKHHLNGRSINNWDTPWNVAYVSPNTHRMIHEGEIIIEGWVESSDGRILMWHKKNEKNITGMTTKPHLIKRRNH